MTFDVYLKQSAVDKAEAYFLNLAQRGLEGMGLLTGEACSGEAPFVLANDFLTAETDSSPVSVRFSRKAFSSIASQLRGEMIVGWCHSHPSYGCFLSTTDIETQRRFFTEDFHVAAVFDPFKTENFGKHRKMAKRFYKLSGDAYREVSFAVIK